MTTEHNEGFAAGFKAGWDAAFEHLTNTRPVSPSTIPGHAFRPMAAPQHVTGYGPQDTNPWTAHTTGGGRLSPEEYAGFQQAVSGLNLHTTTPEYDTEDATFHQKTRVY